MEIYFQIIWKRLFYVLVTAFVAIIIAIFITIQTPPYYVASARLLLQPFGLGTPDYATYLYSEQLTATFSEILRSYPATLDLANRLGLETDDLPDYSVALRPNSELLQITVQSIDPKLAKQTADELVNILLKRVDEQYGANLDSIEHSLETLVNELESDITLLIQERAELIEQVPRDNVRIAEIDRLLITREGTYNTMLASFNKTLIDQSAQSSLISVFEPATEPLNPSGPSKVLNVLAGITTGIVGGLAMAFIMEMLQPKLYSERQVTEVMDTIILDTIPTISRRKGHDITQFGTNKLLTESFRRLRITFESMLGIHYSRNSIAFLNYESSKGHTVVFLNLCLALVHNFKRVVIVDIQSYHPTFHEILELKNIVGLTDILQEKVKLEDALQSTIVDNLDFISAGTQTNYAVELYDSQIMKDLIIHLEETYDYVLFNTPNLLEMSDALVIARHVGTNIIVMKPDSDKRSSFQVSDELNKVGVDVLGIVMYGNRFDMISRLINR